METYVFARGPANLNIASWVRNCELDVVENEEFAHAMHRMYLNDLGHPTETVLEDDATVRPRSADHPAGADAPSTGEGAVLPGWARQQPSP